MLPAQIHRLRPVPGAEVRDESLAVLDAESPVDVAVAGGHAAGSGEVRVAAALVGMGPVVFGDAVNLLDPVPVAHIAQVLGVAVPGLRAALRRPALGACRRGFLVAGGF